MELGIVIATYNRADLLQGCLDALAKQTEPAANFEVIVVVDGSTDDSAEVLASYTRLKNFSVHVQSNQGVGAARNKGAEISSARVLLFLDDDMVAAPDLVSTHMEAHRAAGEIVGLYTITRFKGEGIGERLVSRLLADAESRGLDYVFACAVDGRAQQFFERLGFERVSAATVPAAKWVGYDRRRRARVAVFRRRLPVAAAAARA